MKKLCFKNSVLFLFFSLLFTGVLITILFVEHKKSQQKEIGYFSNIYQAKIETLINDLNFSIKIEEGIIKFMQNNPLRGDLDSFSKIIIKEYSLRNISILPNGIVQYIYPLEDNVKAIGDNIFTMPNRRKEAEVAIKTKKIIISGPDKLSQGGEGILIRKAVFNKDGSFWGMIAIVMDLDKLNNYLKLSSLNEIGYQYELYSQVNDGKKIIIDKSKKFNEKKAHFIDIPLANGKWVLGIHKNNSWYAYLFFITLIIFGFLLSFLIFFILEKKEKQLATMEQEIYTDPLTRLYNRKKISDIKHLKNFTLFYIDLNDFKFVNDTYGHNIGNKLLIFFGKSIKNLIKDEDLAIRMGGDEFVLIVNNLTLQKEVDEFCKKLEALRKLNIFHGKEYIYVKFSYGYAISSTDTNDITSLLQIADSNMYKNKKTDKNKKASE